MSINMEKPSLELWIVVYILENAPHCITIKELLRFISVDKQVHSLNRQKQKEGD